MKEIEKMDLGEKLQNLQSLKGIIEEINREENIPRSLWIEYGGGMKMVYDEFGRYVIEGKTEVSDAHADHMSMLAQQFLDKLADAYEGLTSKYNQNSDEFDRIMEDIDSEIERVGQDILTETVRSERKEALLAQKEVLLSERKAYVESVERRKRIADEEIMKEAKKMGWKVKKKKIGKILQYIVRG